MQRTVALAKGISASPNAMSWSPLQNRGAGLLQRKCACGGTTGPTGECDACKKKRLGLQTKLAINQPGDIYEQEADRIANQVVAASGHHVVNSTLPRIQRFAGQPVGQGEVAPASVDRALAGPGSPLELPLRRDMEQRFGYDFSRVRVHFDAAAEQSALDVNAHAYTVGHDIVFGPGQFAPGMHDGRRLLAHELTHVVQQSSADRLRIGQTNKKCSLSLPADYSIARKPRTSATDAPPATVKTMARDEARAALGAYIEKADLDDTFAALSAIQETLDMPFTGENARLRLRLLTAAFSLLDGSDAANVLKALTTPVGARQKHLSERFARLDRHFRTPLLDILRERAAKPAPEAEASGKPPAAAPSTAKPTWTELHPGVFALAPDPGTTLNAVAAYVSENPDIPPALARLNKLPRTAPIEAGQSIIIPVEFIQRPKAFQEMSEPMRRYIASTQEAEAQHEAWQRFAHVRTPNLPGPGIGGSMLLTAKLTATVIERIVDALIGLIEKGAYAIAFAAGVVHGFLKSIWDTVSGIAKLIYDVLKSIFSLDLVSDLEKLVGSLKDLSLDKIREMLGDWADDWAKKLHSGNPLVAGHAHGYLTGYVMAEAAMLLLTGGAAEEAKAALWASDLGKLVKGSRAFKTLETAVDKVSKVRRAAGGEFDKAVDALRKSRLGKVVKTVEVTGAAVAWTVDKVTGLLHLPINMARSVAEKLVTHVKQLGPFFERIEMLSERATKWLFGCRSPCEWEADAVEETMKQLAKNEDIEKAAELAARTSRPSVTKPHGEPTKPPKTAVPPEPPKTVLLEPAKTAPVSTAPTVPLSERVARAQQRVAATEESLAATRRDVERARQNVAQAERDVDAAKDLWLEQPGRQGELEKLLRETQDKLNKARRELDRAEKSAQLAQSHATAAASAGQRIAPLEQQIADVDRRINEIYSRNRWRRPPDKSPDGNELRLLEQEKETYIKDLQGQMKKLGGDWAEQLRAGTPGSGAVDKAMKNLGDLPAELRLDGRPFDVTDPGRAPLTAVSPDHIHPVEKILRDPRFGRLTPDQQREILELQKNYFPLSAEANSSKGSLTMDEWFKTPVGRKIPQNLREPLRQVEKGAKEAVERRMEDFLKKK